MCLDSMKAKSTPTKYIYILIISFAKYFLEVQLVPGSSSLATFHKRLASVHCTRVTLSPIGSAIQTLLVLQSSPAVCAGGRTTLITLDTEGQKTCNVSHAAMIYKTKQLFTLSLM